MRNCGKIFSDEEGKTEIALEDTVISNRDILMARRYGAGQRLERAAP